MTAYTTRAKVEAYWSRYGINTRLDDSANAVVEAGEEAYLDTIISQQSAFVGSWLSRRYSVEAISGTNPPTNTPASVEYITNVCVCYRLGRRRDNPVSDALEEDYRQIIKWLEAIAAGQGGLIDLPDSGGGAPFMSNVTVDLRYPRATIRVVTSTSVGPVRENSPRRAIDTGYFNWWG